MTIIDNFPNYSITNSGDIIPNNRDQPLSKWVDNVGYYQSLLYKDGERHHVRIHRLMGDVLLTKTNDDSLLEVNHIDGNKLNNNLDNLELVTTAENTQHGYEEGLYKTNARNILVDVYDKENNFIKTFKSIRSLSLELGLNRKTVSAIMFNNKTNNYNYNFKPIVKEGFYYLQIYNLDNELIDTVPSIRQASQVTNIDRYLISDIINKRVKNRTDFIFKKKYKQCSSETIETTSLNDGRE